MNAALFVVLSLNGRKAISWEPCISAMGLALITWAAFAALVGLITKRSFAKSVVSGLVPFALLAPTISRFSRILWIYFDRAVFQTK